MSNHHLETANTLIYTYRQTRTHPFATRSDSLMLSRTGTRKVPSVVLAEWTQNEEINLIMLDKIW
jgi:hypothetical protein